MFQDSGSLTIRQQAGNFTMKESIVADGAWRVMRDPGMQARLRALRESVAERHAAELAGAGFFRRMILRWRISREYRRARGELLPSRHALYCHHAL